MLDLVQNWSPPFLQVGMSKFRHLKSFDLLGRNGGKERRRTGVWDSRGERLVIIHWVVLGFGD